MGQMREYDAFIYCTKHMFFIVECGQSNEGSFSQRIFVGTVQERQEDHVGILRIYGIYPLVGDVIHRTAVFFGLCLFVAHQVTDEPFHVSGRGGAGFFHQEITRHTEHGV